MQEHAVREAQKLLRYTVLSVSEIAYQLNFSAPTYFARLFKKHIGKTPEAYRKS
jgi:AraC-like DNA-binding protein